MRYESESRTWSIAAATVRGRVRELDAFHEARAHVVWEAIQTCRGRDVPAMRALGGFSSVLFALVDALPDALRVNVGSKLIPWSVCSELATEVPSMREEVQLACSMKGQP